MAIRKSTMMCVICEQGETQPDAATVTLTRDAMTLVVKGVPAQVCVNCGEEYLSENTTARLLRTAQEVAKVGVQVDVREYVSV